MKKNVIVCGLISGLIVSALMVYSMFKCNSDVDYGHSMLLGYASMILAFSMVFVGIKNARDKFGNGVIGFGKAFKTGFYIALIASTMYVVVWAIDYHFFLPDFMDKYSEHMLKQAKESGLSPEQLEKQVAEMAKYKEWYKNPVFFVLITYCEILPLGIVITLISALILKRKPKPAETV